MKSLLTSFKSIKAALVLAASLFSVANATAKKSLCTFRSILAFSLLLLSANSAQALTLKVEGSDESTSICDGYPVELKASDVDADKRMMYQRQVSGGAWTNMNEASTVATTFIDDDITGTTKYRIQYYSGNNPLSEYSNEVTVSIRTEGCTAPCEETTTGGEYIFGTDFNSNGGSFSKIPDDVIHYFDRQNIKFKQDGTSYGLTNNVTSFLGKTPSKDQGKPTGYTNAYMTFKGGIYLCDLDYIGNRKQYDYTNTNYYNQDALGLGSAKQKVNYRNSGTSYTFSTRMYIQNDAKAASNCWNGASIKTRTGHGTVTNDMLEIVLYDDETGKELGRKTAESSGGVACVTIGELYGEYNMATQQHLMRMEITFYGTFPTGDNYSTFEFKPMFEQFCSSSKIAVDYISSAIQSVCMTKSAVCNDGTTVNVITAGFAKNAVYRWEKQSDNSWQPLSSYNGLEQVSIAVDFIGKQKYRVYDENKTGDDRKYIEFEVVGKDCKPAAPESVTGGAYCLPTTGTLAVPIEVTPALDKSTIMYGWSLTAPDGKTVYVNDPVMTTLPTDASVQSDQLFYKTTSETWSKASIHIPAAFVAKMPAGDKLEYTLTVQQYKYDGGWIKSGESKSNTLTFYRTPDATFAISSGADKSDAEKICPYVSPVEFTAKATNVADYTYEWSIGAGGTFETTDERIAGIKLPLECDVKTLTNVQLNVFVTALPICKATEVKNVTVSRNLPVVKCPVGLDITRNVDCAKTTSIEIYKPTIENTCDLDPRITIDFEGSYLENGESKSYSHASIDKKLSELSDDVLTIDFPVTSSSTTSGSIKAIYNAYDVCGNKSATSCTLTLNVIDKTAPNIDCDEMEGSKEILRDLVVKMSTLGNDVCDGVTVSVSTPTLTDQCDGSSLTGVFLMRSDSKKLTDKFTIGSTTIITWRFYDNAGNYSQCTQKVIVVDDRKPKLTCTTNSETIEVSTDATSCTTSPESALSQILKALGDVAPSADNYCEASNTIDESKEWSTDGTTWKDWSTAIDFEKDVTYQVRWVFTRHYTDAAGDDQTITDYCTQKFVIKDKVKPEVDCSNVKNIISNVNIKTRQRVYSTGGTLHTYTYKEDYASAVLPDGESDGVGEQVCKDDPEYSCTAPGHTGKVDVIHNVTNIKSDPINKWTYDSEPGYEFKFALADQLVAENIPTAVDKCDGALSPVITVYDKDGVATAISGIDDLRKFKFLVASSPYTIKYVFTDNEGNSDLCEQTITAVRQGAPITNCWDDNTPLTADANCEATTDVYSYENVPAATIKYNKVTVTSSGGKATETVSEVTKSIYPYKIVRQYYAFTDQKTGAYDATPTSEVTALNNATVTSEYTKEYKWPASGTNASINIYETKPAESQWSKALSTTFPLGVTKITLYYQNDNNTLNESYEEAICEATIIVEDKTNPVVDCKGFQGTITKKISTDVDAQANCGFTWTQVALTKPEVSQLDIQDNCSGNSEDNAGNFTISGFRYYEGLEGTESGTEIKESDADFKADFPIGTTEVIWRIFDLAGNSDPNVCKQKVVVVDDVAPLCPELKDIEVDVQNEKVGGCYALPATITANDNFNAGITTEDDKCSPAGGDILYYQVTRSDGKALLDNYPVGTTKIIWWFKDKALVNNEVGCEQNVIVTDNSGPKFDCLSDDRTYYIETGCSYPSDKVNWGVPTPTDNCDGDDPTKMTYTLTAQQMKSRTQVKPGTSAEEHVYDPVTMTYSPVIPDLVAGLHKMTWVITDSKGNTSDPCTFYIQVVDTIPPRPDCPPSKPLEAEVGACETDANLTPDDYKFTDPCDNIDIIPTWERSDKATSLSDAFHIGDTYVTWTWQDTSKNSYSCKQLIHVKDMTPPELTCTHVGETIEVGTVDCEVNSDKIREKMTLPTATDACDDLTPTRTTEVYYKGLDGNDTPVKQVDSDNKALPWTSVTYQTGYYTIDFIFSDTTGNSDKCSVNVYVKDESTPDVTCPDERIEKNPLPDECTFSFSGSLINSNIGKEHCLKTAVEPTAHLFNHLTKEYYEEPATFPIKVYSGDSITIRWDYKSQLGYTRYCFQKLVVVDNQWPADFCTTLGLSQIDLVADDGECKHTVTPTDIPVPSFEDNCGTIEGELVSYIYISGEEPDTTLANNVIPTSFKTGKTILRWRFHDTAHEDTCSQTVFVKGSIEPDFDCNTVKDKSVTVDDCEPAKNVEFTQPFAEDVCQPVADLKKVPGYLYLKDKSGKDSISLSKNSFDLGKTPVKWTFTEFTGNVSKSCPFNVIVKTTQIMKPNCPSDKTTTLKGDVCLLDTTVKQVSTVNPCSGDIVNGVLYLNGNTTAESDLDISLAPGPNVLKWVFTDMSGILVDSVATCTQTITIDDPRQPSLPCSNDPIDITLDDECVIDAFKVDFKNTGIEADEICPQPDQDDKVKPLIWVDDDKDHAVKNPNLLPAFNPGEYTIHWEYTFHPSGIGNYTNGCNQKLTIKTDKKIVTNCDADNFKDINVYADATCQVPASEVKFDPANATNPCDASVVLKPQAYLGTEKVTDNVFTAPFPKGTTVVTWKYTDPTGTLTVSEAECPQNVVVTDTTKPEVTCEADKDYFLGRDADGKQSECEAAAGVIDLQRPTVSDNCSSDASDFKFWLKRELNGEEVDSAAAFKVGTTNVTWTVMDKDGNTQTCTMKVVVNDTVTPKLDCPADMLDLQAKEGECGVIIDDIVPTGIKDACDTKLIVPEGTRDDGLALTDSFPTGKTTVITWVYTDSIGNQTTCKQNIFVKDVTKPDVDCSNTANPINVETELGQCEVPSSVVVDKIKLPTAKDKCQTEAPVMTSNRWYLGRAGDSIPTRQLVGGEDIAWNDDVPFKAGYYQIHFIFTDLAGNADSCSQVVFVKDSNPPYLNNCEEITDQTLNPATGECDAPIVPLDLNSYKGHEVCTGVEIEGVPSLLVKEGDDFVVSADAIPATVSSGDSIYIRWTYTSQMGVSAYCDQKIKVVDNQKPTIDCDILTPDINLVADADKCEISAANADIKYPTVEDNCGTITGRPVRIDTLTGEPNGLTMDDPYPTGKSVIRWYFEDTNDENTQYCDQVVYVKGSVNPEIDCDTIEGKVLVDTINTCDITEQTLKVVAPVAIDKCAPTDALKSVTGVGTRSDGKAIDDLYPLGITTITWTFTDFTGNASTTCTQKVNIVTRQKMIMDCADTVATYDLEEDECLKAITLDQRTAKHPCPDAVDADKQVIKGVAYLNGSLEALTSLDIKLPQGSHVITWVFTDDTHTLANPVDTCYDSIKVGNNNVPPVPCVNENIDTTLQDVCEISAAEIKLNNTGVEAPQLCGDEGEMVVPSIWRTSNPTKVVNTPADLDAFTTGKDTVIWKYDFNPGHLGIYTVYCKQAIDVKTTKEIELACPDSAANTIEIVAPAGLCEVPADTITLNPLVGKNPCIDTVFIHGVPDRDTTLAWPLGVTTITWTYTDTTNTLTNPTATCKQYVSVKDTVNPEIDCETLYNDVKLTTKVCELSADDLGLKGQPVTQCEFVMDPVPTRFSGKDFNDPYVIGNDTVYWTYTYEHNGKSTVCPQAIILRDTAPVFDCEKLKDTTLTADDEECVINKSLAEVLDALDPYPTAVDPCDASYTIKGTYKLADVDTLPTQLTAGDTLHVVWSFADTTRSADTTTCDQLVIIKGNATPEINCDEAAPALKDTIDDCGPDHDLLVIVPKAFDKCFGDSIPGSFVRSDKAANLNDPFALGDTYIKWTFWNIDSTKSTTCEQNIHIYTNREIVKPCDTAALATIVVDAPEDACTVDASDVDIPRQYALNPCNGDTIWGVMSRPNASAIDAPYNIGKNLLVWTFTDTTNTLVKSVDTCRQYVNVGSVEVEPVSCDSFPNIEKVLAEGNCSIDAASLGIKAPSIIDRCPNGSAEGGPVEVLPVITRYTKPGWTSSQASELEEFTVGVDTIWWSYPRFETVCAQAIHIWDSVAPKFDCDNLQPIVAVAPDGTCELNVDSVLVKPYPVAHEACTDSAIVGVPTLLNGDPLPETLKVGDSIVVLWTFELPELSTKAKTCEQPIRAMGTAAPQFDCESLKLLEFVTDGCDINLDQDSIETPVATDSCTGKDVPGVGVRADGGDLYGTYPLGKTTITWTFTSPDSKVSKSCEQVVEVKTKQEIDAKCGEENYPSLSYEVKDGKCTVPADSVSLTAHEAYNPCNTDIKITGVATRSDSLAITDAFPIGVTTITWTFTDTTNTLVNPTSSCTQTVTVVDHNIPDPDCETSFPAVRLVLDDEDCDLDFSKIPVYINQIPTNPCSGELAMIDTSRTSGKGVHDPYTVGSDTLVWKFWFPTNNIEVFCYQKVTVADTIAPAFDCNTLADTIEVEIMTEGNTVTFEEVKAKGFYIPEVTDKCTEVFTEVTRSDNKELEDDYMLGNTDVTFRFSDAYGNDTICMQTIKVVDMIPPKVICPPLENTLSCADDTTPAYKTFEEFKAAGGSVDPESKADLFSFRHEDTREGDDCKAVITREYFLTSINNVNVHCESAQHFYVRDSIAPVYVGIPTGGYSIVSSCDNPNDEPLEVTATDNCDPEPVVSYERVSTQGSDPSQCDYYTYDVTYTYKAVDRCGNAAEPVVYTIHVKDTVAPSIRKPEHWDDVMYPVYLKHCEFGTPDITAMIPSDSIDQNCGDNQYLTIWQEPAAGTKIETTTVVNLHIVDVCGNDMVMHKTVAIQPREEIIDITILHKPYLACGSDDGWLNPRSAANSLTSSDIKRVYGKVKVEDWDGTWGDEITNAVVDYYRDTVDFDHLVYSSPGATYSDLFKNTEPKTEAGNLAFGNCVLLTRRSQSDTYYFVATDTVTGCTDTASVYIDVRERPRIALESGQWNICEGDSLTLKGEFGEAFAPCVDEMGSSISAEGWMVNDSVYHPLDSVNYDEGIDHMAVYYATNECGTTTSLNSLYTSCAGDLETHADSLAYAGSESRLEEMKNDSLYVSDSVKINVYTHYDPTQVLLTTDPQDKARIWIGDEADLVVTMPYEEPSVYKWMQVVGDYDAEQGAEFDKYGNIIANGSGENDDEELQYIWDADDSVHYSVQNTMTVMPVDTSYYYVVVGNGVCPTVSSNLVSIDLLDKLPTAITPYTKDGMNDDFVRGHHVIIFNRYGQQVFEGNDGWDGTYRGLLADPGVYFYTVDMAGGVVLKGSVEVVKIK